MNNKLIIRFFCAFLVAAGCVSAQPSRLAVAQPRYCYTTYQNLVRRDTVTNTASWNGYNATEQVLNSDTFYSVNPTITFVGDGNKLNRVGMIVMGGSIGGVPNAPFIPNTFNVKFTYFPTIAAYNSDPFGQNPINPNYTHVYSSANLLPGWQTVVGHRIDGYGNWNLYYFQLDVSSLNIQTVQNQVHLVGMMIHSQADLVGLIQPGVMAPLSGDDYYADWLGGNSWHGPAPMPVAMPGLYGPNVAGYVSTRRTIKRCDFAALYADSEVACIPPAC